MTRFIDLDAFIAENEEFMDCEIEHRKYQFTVRELLESAKVIEIGEETKTD